MKIKKVDVQTFSWPLPKPFYNSAITFTRSGTTIVSITTEEGIVGYGYAYTNPVIAEAIRFQAPKLLQEDALDVERLWHKMWQPKQIGRRGLTTQAISALDIALWDIRGKAAEMPLYKMLGGFRRSVPIYIAGGYYSKDKRIADLQKEMAGYVERGASAVKMKIGGASPAEDIERIRAVRSSIGPDIRLMVDANCAYRAHEAISVARRIEEYDIFWFEEPVAPDDYDGLKKVSEKTSIPIAAGENEYTKYGFRDLLANGAISICMPDAKVCGGITEFMKIAALTQADHLEISPHGSQEVHTHLGAALSNTCMVEYFTENFDVMLGKRYKTTIELNADGTVSPPNLPGFGAEPNYDELNPYRVA